jgi:hypothetical protein
MGLRVVFSGASAAVAAALAEVARRQQSDVGSKEEKKKSLWANKTSQAATWQTLATSLGDTARQDKFLRLMGAKGKEAIPIAQDQDGGNASVVRGPFTRSLMLCYMTRLKHAICGMSAAGSGA